MCPPCSVSVVIPVRNGAAFVVAAIESVLAQGEWIAQVIVVENNSTDETRVVLERFVHDEESGRVVIAFEEQANAANARNTGVRLATSDWLAFLDADDLWLPGKLDRQMHAKDEHPGAELLFTLGQEFVDAAAGELVHRKEPYAMLMPSSLLVKREVFEAVGEFPNVSSGEFIAWFGWARQLGYIEFVVPEVLVKRRIHTGNSTRSTAATAAYPAAMKWMMDKRRARQASS